MVARRAVAAGAVMALALAMLSGSGSAEDEAAASCDQATLSAGTSAGALGPGNREDWWRMPALPGSYVVTLVSPSAVLTVGNAGCGTLCEAEARGTPGVCTVRSTDGGLTIGLRSGARLPVPYAVSVAPFMPSVGECDDRLDNDGDGIFDFPADAGCSSLFDMVEDDAPCSPYGPIDVCHEIVTGGEFQRFQRDVPRSQKAEVAAYVRWYQFTVMGVPTRPVPCVDVVRPVASRPCLDLGGRFTGTETRLYDDAREVTDPTAYKNVVVRVCDATLNVTVAGHRAPPIGIYKTPC